MLELRHLKVFVTLAEELHFGRAASRLRLAQPALSQQIKRMETDLGVKLFVRTSRRVALTEAGSALLPNARALLADAARAEALSRRAAAGEVGTFRIGFLASGSFALLPDILKPFRASFPDVVIQFDDGPLDAPVERLESGAIDVAIVRDPNPDPRVRAVTLHEERIIAVLPASHRLASRKRIDLSALAGNDFVMCRRASAPRMFDKLIALCDRHGFNPHIVNEAADWQVLASLVAAGFGVMLAPASVRRTPREGVSFVDLTSHERLATLVLLHPADRVSAVTAAFVEIAIRVARRAA